MRAGPRVRTDGEDAVVVHDRVGVLRVVARVRWIAREEDAGVVEKAVLVSGELRANAHAVAAVDVLTIIEPLVLAFTIAIISRLVLAPAFSEPIVQTPVPET